MTGVFFFSMCNVISFPLPRLPTSSNFFPYLSQLSLWSYINGDYPQHQSAVYFSIVLFTALYISLFFSIYGFFFQRKWIVQLILWQLPLRLIWVVPSYPTMEILYELLWLNRSISFGEISFIVWGALLVFELFKIFLLCSFKSNR